MLDRTVRALTEYRYTSGHWGKKYSFSCSPFPVPHSPPSPEPSYPELTLLEIFHIYCIDLLLNFFLPLFVPQAPRYVVLHK